MNTSRKRKLFIITLVILVIFVTLSCNIFVENPSFGPNETDIHNLATIGGAVDANATRTKEAYSATQAYLQTKAAAEAESTRVVIERFETQGAAQTETMNAMRTNEAGMVYGIQPQKVTC